MRVQIIALVAALACGSSFTGQEIDRTKPPQTGPVPDIKVPGVSRFELPNGMKVLASEDRRFPLATLRLAFAAGTRYDPKDLPGLSENVAALLNQGTKTRSAEQIAKQAADAGGQIGAQSTPDTLTITANGLSTSLTPLLRLVSDLGQNASFPDDEVQLQKENGLETLKANRSNASYVAHEMEAATLFESHPYGHTGPSEGFYARMSRPAIVTFRDTFLVPNNATLILVGQLPEADELKRLVTELFGSWQRKTLPQVAPAPLPNNQKRIVLVDRPGSVQADIRAAHIAPTYKSSEFFPVLLGDRILGGTPNSRMFIDIREKRGFAYDAHSETTFMREAGTTAAVTEVRNEVVQPALEALNGIMHELSTQNVSATELTEAKSSYAGTFILRLERQSGMAAQLERIAVFGLPPDYLDTYMTHIRSVEADDIRKTGNFWAPENATVVVVGDASKIKAAVEKIGPVQVVKAIQ